jgi:Zn-dependent protease with chaperone function
MNPSTRSGYAARWFDGRTASVTDADVDVEDGILRARAGERQWEFPIAEVRASAPIAGVPLRLSVPDGGVFVLADATVGPQALGMPGAQGLVHRLERNPVVVVAAVVAVVTLGVLGYYRAIPWLSDKIADRVPVASEARLGSAVLENLDEFVFAPSELPAEQRAQLQARFNRLADAARLPVEPQLAFRSSKIIGANALTLPGGTVVVTDQLIARVESPDEVAAVFAHELGHAAHRHTLRRLLEQSGSAMILGAVLGDVSGIGSLVAAAPLVLVRLSYSRGDEQEADDYALALLPQAGFPPTLLADALGAISSSQCSRTEAAAARGTEKCNRLRNPGGVLLNYLSTHPDIATRIERARAAAQ